jgi:hypothetical protein
MGDKYTPVLLAALLALAATLVIQVVVVPWVQARTRAIERWETSVTELASLVDEAVPRAAAEFRSAADGELIHRYMLDNPDYRQDGLREALSQARNERRQADAVLSQHRRQVKILVRRVTKRRNRAVPWRQFRMLQLRMDHELGNFTYLISLGDDLTEVDDPRLTDAWAKYQAAEKEFAKVVDDLATSMRPPPLDLRARLSRKIKGRFKPVLERGDAAPRLSPALTKPDAAPGPVPQVAADPGQRNSSPGTPRSSGARTPTKAVGSDRLGPD